MVFQQLLREWPPGYGGVERVAQSWAMFGRSGVQPDVQGQADGAKMHFRGYPRKRL